MSGISSASLVDLKAELFRKQEEFKKQKLLHSSTNYIKGKTSEKVEKKTSIFSRKNAGVTARSQKDLVAKAEEEDLHEKSRKILEAKSKLYERISQDSGIPDEDGNQRFLVDFQKKAIDKQQERQNKEEQKEENDYSEDEFVDSPSNPDEKWVEYTDSLGRTRTCMKKDLVSMQRKDKELGILPTSQKKEEKIEASSVGSSSQAPVVLSSQEIYCQMLKEKWNKEEEEAQAKPAGPVHYENVRFDEIRTHGVGYFQFAKDETARQEQMDLLNTLRDQTKDERNKRNQVKEKRDSLMAARLKKIKDRQRAKLGLPPEPEMEEESSPDPKIPETIPIEVKPEVVAKNPAPVREWDLGKDKLWEREKKYFQERREERDSQFAPPSFYASSNVASAPKRRIYQEEEYSPPPERKVVPQKLKKGKNKQQKKNETVKEKKVENCPVVVSDLATIPLPGETIPRDPNNEKDQTEQLTNNSNNNYNSYAAEYQQPQPVGTSTALSENIVPSWGQPAAMTTPQDNAIYVAAFSNQQQSVYPGNIATTTAYQYTQAPSSDNVTQYTQAQSSDNVIQYTQAPPADNVTQYTQAPPADNTITQQTVIPEKPKPTILDRRFVKNVESLQSL